jgi:hypothetical protein|tara:strand:+ start:296 stop:583 length:288 start_codon:yes stop_codon:yes gene_type:complete
MNTITIIILVNLGVLIFGTLFYIIWNLMKKNERLEDMNGQQNTYIQNVSTLMSESNRKLKEIDSKQIFESDDEIGWFFKGIKEIQELINEYNILK